MKYKKLLSLATASVLACSLSVTCAACGKDGDNGPNPAAPTNTYEYDIPQDYCRTYYEVFVRSFADGNGDGIGDFKGLIEKLDYLNDGDDSTTEDLGINGIWLMPINSSNSYHKYDVKDYYNVDAEYGTLDDFDKLVEECNKRDIWLQMDLVLNHTSKQHPWFKQALTDARNGLTPETSEAMAKYCFKLTSELSGSDGYAKVSDSPYSYLCNFSVEMPDLNLSNIQVREEIKNIIDFWLERGVHSFRLDAVPWAFADGSIYTEENGEFWTWFNDYCNQKGAEVFGKENDGINSYCYNVGEVWTGNMDIEKFFGTGMSCFNYSMGGADDVGFAELANGWGTSDAGWFTDKLAEIQAGTLAKDPDAIMSNFLSNHDNDRSAGYFNYDQVKIKKAAALYLLAPGNPYIYYGEEIGAAGSGVDPNKRLPFNWGDGKYNMKNPPGANYDGTQKFGTWKSQNRSTSSILTFYRNAIQLRNRFPEIGRGVMTPHGLTSDNKIKTQASILAVGSSLNSTNSLNSSVAVYTLTWKNRTILIVHNTGTASVTLDTSEFAGYKLVGDLKANGGAVKLNDSTLTMSPATVALLHI